MKLFAVTDDKTTVTQLVETLIAIEPYIDAVILREKSKTDCEVIDLIQKLIELGFNQSKLIVHGRADIAFICDIHKIQLPGHGIPLALAKEHFHTLSFGRSVHSLTEAEIAVKAGVNWLIYGHLYETDSKKGAPPRGIDELSRIIQFVRSFQDTYKKESTLNIPVYAIGGIKPHHLPALQQVGATGVAVMSSIFGSDDPASAAKSYKEALHNVTIR